MITDRRVFLGSIATAALAANLPATVVHGGTLPATLQSLADALLATAPERRTALGLDKGTSGAAKSRLDEQSVARFAHDLATLRDYRGRLAAFDRSKLRPADQIELDSVLTALDLGIAGSAFSFGNNSFDAAMGESARPYVVTQSSGAIFSGPRVPRQPTQHRGCSRCGSVPRTAGHAGKSDRPGNRAHPSGHRQWRCRT